MRVWNDCYGNGVWLLVAFEYMGNRNRMTNSVYDMFVFRGV